MSWATAQGFKPPVKQCLPTHHWRPRVTSVFMQTCCYISFSITVICWHQDMEVMEDIIYMTKTNAVLLAAAFCMGFSLQKEEHCLHSSSWHIFKLPTKSDNKNPGLILWIKFSELIFPSFPVYSKWLFSYSWLQEIHYLGCIVMQVGHISWVVLILVHSSCFLSCLADAGSTRCKGCSCLICSLCFSWDVLQWSSSEEELPVCLAAATRGWNTVGSTFSWGGQGKKPFFSVRKSSAEKISNIGRETLTETEFLSFSIRTGWCERENALKLFIDCLTNQISVFYLFEERAYFRTW